MIHLGMCLSYNSSQNVRGSLLGDFLEVSFFLRRARRRGQLISHIGYCHLLEEEMTTHFSILARIIPHRGAWKATQFMGSQRVRHDWNWEHTLSFLHGTFSCGNHLGKSLRIKLMPKRRTEPRYQPRSRARVQTRSPLFQWGSCYLNSKIKTNSQIAILVYTVDSEFSVILMPKESRRYKVGLREVKKWRQSIGDSFEIFF